MNQVKQPKQPKALPSLKDAVSFRLFPDVYQHPSKFQKEFTLNPVSYTHLTLPTTPYV